MLYDLQKAYCVTANEKLFPQFILCTICEKLNYWSSLNTMNAFLF